MMYGKDRWYRSLEITADNRRIIWRENGVDYMIDLELGTYWVYSTAGAELAGYPSIFKQIRTALGYQVLQEYDFDAGNPDGGTNADHRGLSITRDGALAFSLRFDDAAWTFPREVFGVAPDRDTALDDTAGTILSPKSVWGWWVSPKWASRKIAFPSRRLNASTEDIERVDAYQLDFGTVWRRLFEYRGLPGVLVHSARGLRDDYASVFGLADDDVNAAFAPIWESLSDLGTCIVLHDDGDSPLAANPTLFAGQIEYVRLASLEHRREYEACLELTHSAGEFYNLKLPTIRMGGDYPQ